MGTIYVQGVQDIYEGYETGTRGMRQFSGLQDTYEVGITGEGRHKGYEAGTKGTRQVQGRQKGYEILTTGMRYL